jgi:threonine/homoserine/homoserine lactone efflux protein
MHVEYFLSAIVLGLIVSIPPGSATIVGCQKALRNGFKDSLLFTVGSCIADIFYIVLVYYGVAKILSENHFYKIVLWIVCGILLNYFGISNILFSKRLRFRVGENNPTIEKSNHWTITEGILITLTNPLTIVGWIAIAGNFFLLWNSRFKITTIEFIVTIAFIMLGSLLWFIPLIFVVSKIKRYINRRVQQTLFVVSGLLLNLFGFVAFYSAMREILNK